MAPLRTERGLDRLVNFTDAAVAISITLLILPLADLSSEIAHESLGRLLAEHWQNILAFLISFAVIGNLWLVHHRLFELVEAYDAGLARLNLLWLAAITALPFSTNVVASAATGQSAVYALYLGNMVVASGTGVLLRAYLARHPALLREDAGPHIHVLASAVPTFVLLLALVLAVLVPVVGPTWLLLLLGASPIERAIMRRRQDAA